MGDRSIQSRAGEGFGGLHVDTVDASSKQTEVFSEQRVVDGQTVFLAPESAQQLDGSDRNWTVHVNGSTWDRLKAAIEEWRSQ